MPAGLDSVGRGSLPNGAAWYRAWVRDHTTMDLEPEAIHALGLNEVARIHRELAELAPQMGYRGDPKGLLAWVRSNPRYQPFRSDKDVLAAYRAIDAEVRLHLPRLFGRSPKATLRILPEPELTKATASSHYALPAEDGSRPGIFWAVIDDASQYSASDMTALFLHEGQPGHHFHLAMQQEMPLPRFRRLLWINAFGEGWALYAETLGHEMGLYKDPVAYAGFLRLEMVRAARLVVDTGIHAKGWSRGQALAYLQENTGFSEAQSISQIDRYIVWPAQALGYKVGSLKIQELREQAIKAWGSSFDIAAFHDALLEEGALPLPLLEAKMNSWIDTAKHDTELPECRRC